METIGSFDARVHWSKILEQVISGQEFIITKHGKPIARLVPEVFAEVDKYASAIERLKKMRKGTSLDGMDWKALKAEGRA